jgi:hypothetical protein
MLTACEHAFFYLCFLLKLDLGTKSAKFTSSFEKKEAGEMHNCIMFQVDVYKTLLGSAAAVRVAAHLTGIHDFPLTLPSRKPKQHDYSN